ncbi:PREDICTED: TBC1 domain family member 20 [Vollenhovia emeryi]|uniref:TBC1 domain family member 20 n=1 Tax=Vollenhovia emeryi TaxID=411798 RepID=UPI0005F390F5|nr:PREDICTED: TBC1 domain family member 20 [Vollenhovia emeryi]
MEAENEEVPATGPSTPTENHNHNRVRRRNVPEQSASLGADATSDRVPLVALPDLTKAWYDGVAPRIPDHVGADVDAAAGKRQRNGVLAREDDRGGATDAPASAREKMKLSVIRGSIANPDLTLGELRLLGCSSEGFVNDDVRRVLWPKLLRLSRSEPTPVDGLETVHKYIPNEIYQQIQKDVARSGSHISQSATEQETECFQEQLTQLMCWVLHRHSQLNYYQGYNDVAATVLLVVGLQAGVYVLERISLQFLERFMEKTMEKVNQELFYIFALLERVHPTLLEHLENVELFPHFALAEYTTWYAHKYAENRKLLHRLFDFFLGSPPLMPLYLSTVIVAHRATEIFNTTPDMGHTHKVLCTLPDDLPFETLLVEAKNLYRQYPPESITNDVKDYDHKRKIKEQEWKAKAEASRQERERQRKLKIVQATPRISYRIRSYKTITVVTILALGIYAFIRSSTGLN